MNLKIDHSLLAPMALMALMAATRMHHVGSGFSLPDASLAVFFLAGMLVHHRVLLPALLVGAGLLDYLAINQFGVSDYCVTPAYVFLIPTYATMWFAGRCSKLLSYSMPFTLLVAAAATSSAFIISNTSFFLFSNHYNETPMLEYAHSVAEYYQPYLASALFYTVVGLAVVKANKAFFMIGKEKKIGCG